MCRQSRTKVQGLWLLSLTWLGLLYEALGEGVYPASLSLTRLDHTRFSGRALPLLLQVPRQR